MCLDDIVSEVLEQRDADLVALLDRCVEDGKALDVYLLQGNVVSARHVLEAIGYRLGQMRRLLP